MVEGKKRVFMIAPLALVGMLFFVAVGGALVTKLWNWLLPQLFGWPEITFWQGLGLLALCRILFGGFGFRGYGGPGARRRMMARCERMTPEERERFRQGARERWGAEQPPGEGNWQ